MASTELANGTPGRNLANLTLELHRLIALGKGDEAEADNLRAEMEAGWYQLTPEEQRRLNELSGDLYALEEPEDGQPMSAEERQKWLAEFRAANSDRKLEFLRHPPSGIARELVFFIQASCWDQLGYVEVALHFMKAAEQQNPEHAVSVPPYLEKLGRVAEAHSYANRILEDPESRPEALYVAASVLLGPTRYMTAQEAKPILARLVPILEKALAVHLRTPRARQIVPQAASFIVCMLGLCYTRLGQTEKAIEVYDAALKRSPHESEIFVFRGLAHGETEWSKALEDFEEAYKLSSRSVWPYFFLAHNALEHSDYGRCQTFAIIALEKTRRPEILAQLHEWLGICRAIIGLSPHLVWQCFDHAEELDPDNPRIKYNRGIAEKLLGSSGKNGSWATRTMSIANALEQSFQELEDEFASARTASTAGELVGSIYLPA